MADSADRDACVPRDEHVEAAQEAAAVQRAKRPCACSVELADEARRAALSHWCYLDAVPCTLLQEKANGAGRGRRGGGESRRFGSAYTSPLN